MEIWKQISIAPVYEVSNLGRVRHGSRILHTRHHRNGYVITTLGVGKPSVYIHHIVAAAFIGPRPEGQEIDHIDANKENNTPENLEYVTTLENMQRAWKLGLMKPPSNESKARGERVWCSKLTVAKVQLMRYMRKEGTGPYALARLFHVKPRQVFKVINRQQWKHVL